MSLRTIFSRQTKTPTDPVSDIRFSADDGVWPLQIKRHPQARRMSLRLIEKDRVVRLTLPRSAPLRPALAWVETKRNWVTARLANRTPYQPLVPGMQIPFGNRMVRLVWSHTAPRTPSLDGDCLYVGGPQDGLQARVLRWLKREALTLLEAETRALALCTGKPVLRVSVGDPGSRWGSCSSNGTIRYSWRLVLAPEHVRRMIVAHEVAHLVHMNHSPAFHALALSLAGEDPRPANRWLRANSARLHGFGGAS